jgi:hypothetical protein
MLALSLATTYEKPESPVGLTNGKNQAAKTQVSIRIDLETGGRIGPGKIALLEAISKTRSLTAAARSMNMSRMTAWLLVEEINKLLSEPAVTTQSGAPVVVDAQH